MDLLSKVERKHRSPKSMGHRRINNGRSGARSFPGRYSPDRRNPVGASQITLTNRVRSSLPKQRLAPVCCSSEMPPTISWAHGGSHRSCLVRERGSPQHQGLPQHIPSYSENVGSGNGSINNICSTSNSSIDSNGNSSFRSSSSSKKGERHTSTRPSNPLRYKTELCRSYEECGECRFGEACTFAHGLSELRAVHRHPLYKTDLCRTYHSLGYCQYGARCHFVHDLEEAAGVSPMRGFKIRSGTDRLGPTLLALAESRGSAPSPPPPDGVLLANLRRLCAVKMLQEQPGLLGAPSSGIRQPEAFGDAARDFEALLSDAASAARRSNISGTLTALPSEAGAFIGSNVFDSSQDLSVEPNTDVSLDTSLDTVLWSSSSMSTSGETWCGTMSSVPSLSPDPEFSITPLSISPFCLPHIGREKAVAAGQGEQSLIINPMEMSRSLQLPTIAELCQI